jgi:hypothetical protein
MTAIGMPVGSGHELLGVLLAFVLYTTIALSEWPLLTQLTQTRPDPRGRTSPNRDGSGLGKG